MHILSEIEGLKSIFLYFLLFFMLLALIWFTFLRRIIKIELYWILLLRRIRSRIILNCAFNNHLLRVYLLCRCTRIESSFIKKLINILVCHFAFLIIVLIYQLAYWNRIWTISALYYGSELRSTYIAIFVLIKNLISIFYFFIWEVDL